MPKKQTPESALLRQVMDYLAARHVYAVRMNTGAIKAGDRFLRFGVPGMADIMCTTFNLCGCGGQGFNRIIWLELKAPKGVQSELQKSFQEQVKHHGHTYVVVRKLEDVEAALL